MVNIMVNVSSISRLPNTPAVYVLFGGKERTCYVVYVGIADKLRRRIEQHLITRDSSVATGTSAAGLNPDFITELRWWEHPRFSDRNALTASERVAFDLFQPTLRSRGNVPKAAQKLFEQSEFRDEMKKLLNHEPSGRLVIPTLQDALSKIEQLEKRIVAIEKDLQKVKSEKSK